MTKTIHGKIHGKTIELDEDLGVADGQEVEIQVKVILPPRKWGDGILRTAGVLADDPYWDAIMAEIQQARKMDRRPNWRMNDSPAGHQHLLGSHAAAGWLGSVLETAS